MKCNNCGAQVDGNSCPYCGASLQTDTNASSSEQATLNETKAALNETKAAPTAKNKMKKPIYKKWWFWVIAAILLMNIIGRIGGNNNSNKPKEFVWSNMELSDMLPKPESTLGELAINSKECLSIDVHHISETQYKDYVNSCRNKGFTIDVEEYDTTFTAKNETGYELMLYFFESDKEMSIDLTSPNDSAEEKNNEKDNQTNTSVDNSKSISPNESTIDKLVEDFNKSSKNTLNFYEDFKVSDKESGHYRTEFRLNAYENAIGKSYKMNDLTVDIISTESFGVRIYSDGASLEQCVELIQFASPLLDTTMDNKTLNETINYVKEEKTANGYYYGKLGLLLLGNEQSGFDIMIKTD